MTLCKEARVLYGHRASPNVLHTLFITDKPTFNDLAASCIAQPLITAQHVAYIFRVSFHCF